MNNFRASSCIICNNQNACYHHLKTRKARPDLTYEPRNMIPVCQLHHNEFHNKGINYMSQKYSLVKDFLLYNSWYFDEFLNRWVLDA